MHVTLQTLSVNPAQVHERFCPVHGIRHQPRTWRCDPATTSEGAGRFPLQRWFVLVDFLPGGGACRDHMWPRDPIASPARGHLYDVHFGYQEAVMDWPCKY